MPADSRRSITAGLLAISAAAIFHIGPVRAQQPAGGAKPASAGTFDRKHLPPGYLPRTALPDSVALLPPPPAPGSAAMQNDEATRDAALKLKGTPRWAQAANDALLAFPQIPDDFSCAMGIAITHDATPRLYGLIARMTVDVAVSTGAAKNKYHRTRPFAAHNTASCYPQEDAALRKNGSYPSGHSALGWGWALVLAEVNPGHADAILQRGRDFGESRVVCDVHWQSDVDTGRIMAAATVARLHADPTFRADLDAARDEVEHAAASGAPPGKAACAREAAALAAELP